MPIREFLESYSGQTTSGLIALENKYRIDSIVLAFEQAIQEKAHREPISEEERVILAIEALEREVNNGGYHQFLINSSNEYAGVIVDALRRIGCPKTADMTGQVLAALEFTQDMSPEDIAAFATDHHEDLAEVLGKCDDRFYDSDEPIAERLFQWIKRNQARIRVGGV